MRVVQEILPHFDINIIADGIKKHINDYFKNCDVTVTDIPDLSEPPFYLASPGLCGYTKLLDVGGQDYMTPVPQLDKNYDLQVISTLIDMPDSLFIGAGAGPHQDLNINCELIANIKFDSKHNIEKNFSYTAKCTPEIDEKSYQIETLKTSHFAILGNFLASKGLPGKGIKLVLSGSKLEHHTNFLDIIRQCLLKAHPHTVVALGGVFVLKSGKAKIHIMSDFISDPIDTSEKLTKWLHFYEVPAPLTCVGTLVTHDVKNLALRMEHAHCFSTSLTGKDYDREHCKYAGHYHCDTVPAESSYEAYLVPCQTICRVDQPTTGNDT